MATLLETLPAELHEIIRSSGKQVSNVMIDTFSKQEILWLLSVRRTLAIMYVGDRSAEVEYYRKSMRDILDGDDLIQVEAAQIVERLADGTYERYAGEEYGVGPKTMIARLRDNFGPDIRWESGHTLMLRGGEELIAWVTLLDVKSVFMILKRRVKSSHLARIGALGFLDSVCKHYASQPEFLELYLSACAVELDLGVTIEEHSTPIEAYLIAMKEALLLLN